MALEFARSLLPTIVAQTIQQLGWDSIHESALDVLVDLLDRYLSKLCVRVNTFAEFDGRVTPNLDDLNLACIDLGISIQDLVDYVAGVEPSPLMVDVPKFPACPQKIKALVAAQQSVDNGAIANHNEEARTETEDGSRANGPAGNGTLTTPGGGPEKKPFANDTGMTPAKRLRMLPDEAMHSQYEMKSFLVSDSGAFIPVRPGLRATPRCASPPTPKKSIPFFPSVPAYFNEKNKASESIIVEERNFEHDEFLMQTKFSKKSKKVPKDGLHKVLKPSVKKMKKVPLLGIANRSKLPKPLKDEKNLMKKPKSSGSKKSVEPASRVSDKMMQEMFPEDIFRTDDGNKELQKLRNNSYENTINSVILNSSQDEINNSKSEFKSPSPRPNFTDGKGSPDDNFFLDLGEPSISSQLYKFDQRAAEHAVLGNNRIVEGGGNVKMSLDEDLRISPEPDDSEIEIEIKPIQSAVEDRFNVSSIPSPKLSLWPMEEEEVEELVIPEKDELKATNTVNRLIMPIKHKTKKSKHRTAEQFISKALGIPVKETEERVKKSKHHSFEHSILDFDSLGPRSSDEWDKSSKHLSSNRSTSDLERLVHSKNFDDSDKKFQKHFDQTTSRGKDDWEKKSKHKGMDHMSVDFDFLSHANGDEMDKKLKQRSSDHSIEDILLPRKENEEKEKRSKHRSAERLILNVTPEPQRDFRDRFENVPFYVEDKIQAPEKLLTSSLGDWPKVCLESVGIDEGRREKSKKPVAVIPTPPSVPSPLQFSRSPSSVSLDMSGQPPLKRIKIVTSSGYSSQFEIKDSEGETSASKDYKHSKKAKKKAKKNKDQDRIGHDHKERGHGHKDRERSHDHSDKIKNKQIGEMSNVDVDPSMYGLHEKSKRKTESFSVPEKSFSHVLDDWNRLDQTTPVQFEKSGMHRTSEEKFLKDSREKQSIIDKNILRHSAEDLSRKAQEKSVGKSISNTFDDIFISIGDVKAEHGKKTEEGLKGKSRKHREDNSEKQKSHKKKEKSKSREGGSERKKEEKHKDHGEKSLERLDYKKKKSDKKHEKELKLEELEADSLPVQVPTVPKFTLKFSSSASGASIARTEPAIPAVIQPVEQPPVTNPPIKLRFKTGFTCMPTTVYTPPPAGQSFLGESGSTSTSIPTAAKVPIQPRQTPALLEMPTFSPSPESISIPSPNGSSESEPMMRRRTPARTPTPPSLSIPAPITSKPRLPSWSSSSPSPSRSLSPPTLYKSPDVDGHQPLFPSSSRKSATNISAGPKTDPRALTASKTDASSKASAISKSSYSSKTPAGSKAKASSKVSSPKPLAHSKGIPPSKIMPPSTPVQLLLPPPKSTLSSSKSTASSKAKKRVTTETVSKVVNEDGVITWICPACLVEDKGEEPMIGCDECDDWYHWRCVGVLVEPPEEIPWYCQRCQERSKVSAKTPSSGRGRTKKSKKK